MMPAMSPLMTEGTITRWKIKEGEAFAPGDVLLQIESDIAMIDVEAHSPGILGKILLPDGTTNVPVEQVIALVAKDTTELAALQSSSTPRLLSFNTIPSLSPLSGTMASPRHLDQFKLPLMSPRTPTLSPRTPSLFEMHTMGHGFRSAHVGGPRGMTPRLDLGSMDAASEYCVDVPPCPSPRTQTQDPSTSISPRTPLWPTSATVQKSVPQVNDQAQIDGAVIRRMIVSNLSLQSANSIECFDELV